MRLIVGSDHFIPNTALCAEISNYVIDRCNDIGICIDDIIFDRYCYITELDDCDTFSCEVATMLRDVNNIINDAIQEICWLNE